jgi:hypothetical protein
MRVIVWRPSKQPEIYDLPESGDGLLKPLQHLVQGYLEAIPTHLPHTYIYLNEDGKRLGFSKNKDATIWAKANKLIFQTDVIVGTIVILGVDPNTGYETDVNPAVVFELTQFTEKELLEVAI